VKYSIQRRTALRLQLTDSYGNIIHEMVSYKQNAGKYSTDFNVARIISGIYYFKIFAGKYFETKEMLFRN